MPTRKQYPRDTHSQLNVYIEHGLYGQLKAYQALMKQANKGGHVNVSMALNEILSRFFYSKAERKME